MKNKSLLLLFALLFAVSALAQNAHFDGQTWWNHVKVLADDKFEGSNTGSRGEREAQKYAIEQLKNAGAEPAGVNGFYQSVKFVSNQIVEKDSSLALIRDGKREPLTLGEDAIIRMRIRPSPRSKRGWSSSGMVLRFRRRITTTSRASTCGARSLSISPARRPKFPVLWLPLPDCGGALEGAPRRQHHWHCFIDNPNSMDIAWSRIALDRAHPTMELDYPEFNETESAKIGVTVNPANAKSFFPARDIPSRRLPRWAKIASRCRIFRWLSRWLQKQRSK